MFDQTQVKWLIQAAEQAWYACPHQTCLIRGCPNEQNITYQTRVQKICFKVLIECLMAFKFYQTRPNTIKHIQTKDKQHQTRCPNGKMFGHQTMFDGVWSPNIFRLSRPECIFTSTLGCLVTKQCLTVFGRQTFVVCPGPYSSAKRL